MNPITAHLVSHGILVIVRSDNRATEVERGVVVSIGKSMDLSLD
jgi:hypothetical protein